MIRACITEKNQECIKVTISGHADYAEEGYDIICAAVSMLAVNTVNSIEALTEDSYICDQGEDGFMEISVGDEVSDRTKVLMQSLCIGLKSIQEAYGDTYIEIVTKEA